MATLSIAPEGSSTYTALPEPSVDGYSCTLYQVDSSDSGRDQTGLMHRERVAVKRKIECKWKNVSPSVASAIQSACSGVFFNVKYYDTPTNTQNKTGVFYGGDMPVELHSKSTPRGTVVTVSLNIIER